MWMGQRESANFKKHVLLVRKATKFLGVAGRGHICRQIRVVLCFWVATVVDFHQLFERELSVFLSCREAGVT